MGLKGCVFAVTVAHSSCSAVRVDAQQPWVPRLRCGHSTLVLVLTSALQLMLLLLGASRSSPALPSNRAPLADGPCGSVLHFTQAVSPRGLPPLLGGAVRTFALGTVCSGA